MTRVVRLANFYGPESGGLRTTLNNLGRGYVEAGIEPFLIVPGPADSWATLDAAVRVTVPSRRLPASGGYRVISSRRHLADVLRRIAPDRVEVSDKLTLGWVGGWAAERGIPAVLFSHERIDAILSARVPAWVPLPRLADRWNERLVGPFTRVVCASDFAAEEYRRIGVENVAVVPLGVDLEVFRPAPPGPDRTTVELMCTGRLSKEKRPELAVEVLRELRLHGIDARLTFAGSGPMRDELAAMARNLPVKFLGHVHDPHVLAATVAAADVALAPCPVETFGLSVLEALAAGTPVVTSDRGAAHELIDWSCGRSAPPDPVALARAVCDMLDRPERQRRQAARRRAERYPWSATVSGMLAAHGLCRSPARVSR
jgi:alpha-1,6-mannosyltransferase